MCVVYVIYHIWIHMTSWVRGGQRTSAVLLYNSLPSLKTVSFWTPGARQGPASLRDRPVSGPHSTGITGTFIHVCFVNVSVGNSNSGLHVDAASTLTHWAQQGCFYSVISVASLRGSWDYLVSEEVKIMWVELPCVVEHGPLNMSGFPWQQSRSEYSWKTFSMPPADLPIIRGGVEGSHLTTPPCFGDSSHSFLHLPSSCM